MRWLLVYQSVAQLKERYGQAADTILNNAGVKTYLGAVHDRTTREEVMSFLGEEPVETTSRTSRGWGGGESSVTRGEQHRPKLSADDLARLGEGKAVLVHGNDVPAIVTVPYWWEWLGAGSPEEAIKRQQRGGGERS